MAYIGVCQYCGKERTYKSPSAVRWYCSRGCANKSNADDRKQFQGHLDHKLILKYLKSGAKVKDITKALNCSYGPIYKIMRDHGLQPPKKRVDKKKFKDLFQNEEFNVHKFAKELECSEASVYRLKGEIEKGMF